MVLTLKIKDKEEKLRGIKWKPTATSFPATPFTTHSSGAVGQSLSTIFLKFPKIPP